MSRNCSLKCHVNFMLGKKTEPIKQAVCLHYNAQFSSPSLENKRTVAVLILRVKLVLQQRQLLGVHATLARCIHHRLLLLLCAGGRVGTHGVLGASHGTA